jgi:hypothetical protein
MHVSRDSFFRVVFRHPDLMMAVSARAISHRPGVGFKMDGQGRWTLDYNYLSLT